MRVSILQDQFKEALARVKGAMDRNPSLPILTNVLLRTQDARMQIVGTNLEMMISTFVGAKIDHPGAITLPMTTLQELVNNLSPERIDMMLDEATQTMNIRCGTTRTNIKGIAASEFPAVREMPDRAEYQLPGEVFKQAVAQTLPMVARDDNRPVLTGLYVEFKGSSEGFGMITFAAADGYRLAQRQVMLDRDVPSAIFIVPGQAMRAVAGMIEDEKDICIARIGDLLAFQIGSTVVTSQLLEGKFPAFAGLIPTSSATSIKLYVADLLRAAKRSEIFARDSNFSIRLEATLSMDGKSPGELHVIGKSAERGDSEGMLDAAVEGNELTVNCNVRYLMDALDAIPGDRVLLESNGPAHPILVRPEDDNSLKLVIMPMGDKS